MVAPFLTTKLYIPPPRPRLVPRPHLIQRLDDGLRLGHRLTLVSAPAGFGKTTLVSTWICSIPWEVAWVSLDEGDNDPVQFLNYLIAALQQVDGHIGQTVQQILQSPQLPPAQSLVTPLINDINTTPTALVLVLDDYHLITSYTIHQVLGFLLEHQPPTMHLVISTREDPPFSLPLLRARDQVTEIRERDLRFTAEEAAAFLNQTMGLPLSLEAVQALESRTEGWITGLQLAALALQEAQEDTAAFIAAFTGDASYVIDYLVTEVLQRQPEATRDFLRQTAILDRLTAPLCDAVTARKDSQEILEQLAAANLFLIPLDHQHEWYRYHRLFAKALRTMLDQEEQRSLHQRAARWYEAHGLASQAISHALAYARTAEAPPADSGQAPTTDAAQALDDAERLIRLAADETIFGGGMSTVNGWLDALPDERVRANVELATYKGWMLALTGDMALAEEYAHAAEAHLRQARPKRNQKVETAATNLGKLLALRSFIAVFGRQDYEAAIELATGALQVLKGNQAHWRIIALWAMAESQERTRNITEAIATLRKARRTGSAHGNQVFAVTVDLFLATDLHLHGKRREAVAVCQEAIDRYTDRTGHPSPMAGLIFSRLGTLYHEANQLDLARQCLDQGLALSEQLAISNSIMFSLGFSAPTLHAQGETSTALDALQKAHQFASQTGLADASWPLTMEADIRLQQGDIPFVLRWAKKAGLSLDDAPEYMRMGRHLVYGRLLLAQSRLSDARRWLARLEHFVREQGLYRWLITVHILQALTAERSANRAAAHDLITRALKMAAPEDYYRAFLDEDEQVVALLTDARAAAPRFVDQLFAYVGAPGPRREIAAQPLIEPLSERELEVLRLIGAGLSNREIADELFIAVGTVKRHINHVYGKLGVHSRTQATAKARELRLLE